MRIKGESIISSITIVKTISLLSHPFYLVNKQYFQGRQVRQNSRLFLEKLAIWKWKVFCEIPWFSVDIPGFEKMLVLMASFFGTARLWIIIQQFASLWILILIFLQLQLTDITILMLISDWFLCLSF